MKCQFIKKNKEQCGANSMNGATFCFTHNPKSAKAKKAAITKGGLSLKKKLELPLAGMSLKTPEDYLVLIEDSINRLRTDPLTPQKANSIGYLAGTAIRLFELQNASGDGPQVGLIDLIKNALEKKRAQESLSGGALSI